jgi:hypothetical protein
VPVVRGPRSIPVDSLDLTAQPHPRFLVHGRILSVGGDALMALYAKGSHNQGFLTLHLLSINMDFESHNDISDFVVHIGRCLKILKIHSYVMR